LGELLDPFLGALLGLGELADDRLEFFELAPLDAQLRAQSVDKAG